MLENIEFEIKREPWNKYKLEDEVILKCKLIMVKISKGKDGYLFSHQPIFGAIASSRKKIKKSTSRKKTSKIEKYDISFECIEEKWNEYILSDNYKLLAKIQITQINRTNLYDEHGDPVYNVQWAPLFKIVPISSKKKKK